MKVAVFASGFGSNFEAIIKHFKKSELVDICCLVCDQPEARAVEVAQEHGIDTLIMPCTKYKTKLEEGMEERIVEWLKEKKIDFIVLAGYMRVVKKTLLNAFPESIINIHPSLLPSFRGLNAVKQALDYGVKVTGCTVHFIDEEVDRGKIIGQIPVLIEDGDTLESVLEKVHEKEHELYPKVIEKFAMEGLKK